MGFCFFRRCLSMTNKSFMDSFSYLIGFLSKCIDEEGMILIYKGNYEYYFDKFRLKNSTVR